MDTNTSFYLPLVCTIDQWDGLFAKRSYLPLVRNRSVRIFYHKDSSNRRESRRLTDSQKVDVSLQCGCSEANIVSLWKGYRETKDVLRIVTHRIMGVSLKSHSPNHTPYLPCKHKWRTALFRFIKSYRDPAHQTRTKNSWQSQRPNA